MFPTFGLNLKDDGTGPHIGFNCIGMDWAFMLQVANAQASLTIVCYLTYLNIKLKNYK